MRPESPLLGPVLLGWGTQEHMIEQDSSSPCSSLQHAHSARVSPSEPPATQMQGEWPRWMAGLRGVWITPFHHSALPRGDAEARGVQPTHDNKLVAKPKQSQ